MKIVSFSQGSDTPRRRLCLDPHVGYKVPILACLPLTHHPSTTYARPKENGKASYPSPARRIIGVWFRNALRRASTRESSDV